MEKETRKERLAREKAEWEAEQLRKKTEKAAKKAAKRAARSSDKDSDNDSVDTWQAVEDTSQAAVGSPVFLPSANQGSAGAEPVLVVSPEESSFKTRRVRAVKERKPRKTAEYKNAVRLGLPEQVASMLDDRDRIVKQWREGTLTPEEAVHTLSEMCVRPEDGSLWKLLPRHGGVALIKTGMNGEMEIVEPPRRRKKWPAVVSTVLFALLVLVTLWGTFWPATDTGGPEGRSETELTVA